MPQPIGKAEHGDYSRFVKIGGRAWSFLPDEIGRRIAAEHRENLRKNAVLVG